MLQNLMQMANDLFFIFILIGFIYAYLKAFYGKWGKRVFGIGLLLGLLVSLIRCIITNSIRVKNGWMIGFNGNKMAMIGFIISVVLLIVLNIKPVRNKLLKVEEKGRLLFAFDILTMVSIMFTLDCFIFNTINDAWFYPFEFYDSETGILSSDFLLKLLGYLIGLFSSIALAVSAAKVGGVLVNKKFPKILKVVTYIEYVLYAIFVAAKLFSTLIIRGYMDSDFLFDLSVYSANYSYVYAYISIGIIILLCLFLWVKSKTTKEYYENNAIHRKQLVVWRTAKRVTFVGIAGLILFILCQTWFVDLTTEVIVDPTIEVLEATTDTSGNPKDLIVEFTKVNDMHLHKYSYVTPDGYDTRFIVILKTKGTSNYGIGLDACEICGQAGYYENSDGLVVCRKCGVIMNTQTIGMKGGCNPIVIDYELTDSYISVPVSEMIKNQTKFSKVSA